ncbi:MAG: hypothetical protein M1561_08205 [Gammaproteobacteria bacterium]|nr:hypothetical protein [Gammaproteobacteria bacterium]
MADKRKQEGTILSDTGHNQDLKDAKAERDRLQTVRTIVKPTIQQQQIDDLESQPKTQFEKKETIEQKEVVKNQAPEPDVNEQEGSALSSLGQNGAPALIEKNDTQYAGQLKDNDYLFGSSNDIHG